MPGGEANAQSGSGTVTINLTFSPVQTISVATSQETIDILYATTDDYQEGVSVVQDDHLTVFSTGGFIVSVEASSKNFTRVGGSETIPASDVVVRPSGGTSNQTGSEYFEAALSSSTQPIITSETGGRDLKYNVLYDNTTAGSANRYLDRYVKTDGMETAYRSHITYTITTR